MAERNNEPFGNRLKRIRLENGYGLRRFANLIEMKASNLCDVEHGRRPMPQEYLEPAAEALGLERGTAEWEQFFESARKDDEVPADLRKVIQRPFIPALLRTIDNVQLSDNQIRALIHDIQGGTPQDNECT